MARNRSKEFSLISANFDFVRTGADWWAQRKLELSSISGLSADALHLHAGMLILCLAALLLRRSPLTISPWLVLLVLECSNEAADLMLEGMGSPEATVGAGLHDIANTMAAPTLLLLVGWWQRRQGAI